MAEDVRHSPVGRAAYDLRSQTIERVFADAKEKHGMRYTHHRSLTRVTNWVRLKFAAMNLKKLAVWRWKERLYSLVFLIFKPFNAVRAFS
jgi:Transposase DDE domain.